MLIETCHYKGYEFETHTDEDPVSPRTDYDNLGVLTCWHRRYTLGDRQWDEAQAEAVRACKKGGGIVLGVFLYDHSGITMNTTGFSCPWDSGQVGYIYASRQKILDWFGWSRMSEDRRKQARAQLVSEVETYDDYLTGSVYGFVIQDEDESCWGFYDKGDMIKEVYSTIDGLIARDCTNQRKAGKVAERTAVNSPPLNTPV